jgi:hypothetical protein
MKDLPITNQSVATIKQANQEAEELLRDLLKEVHQDHSRLAGLRHINIKQLSPAARTELSKMLAQQLRGQIPQQLAKALIEGRVEGRILRQLVDRLANTFSPDGPMRPGRATNPDAARFAASNPELPRQSLRWGQFVQQTTQLGSGDLQGRGGSASPKGETTVLAEMLAAKLVGGEGPGLRNPTLVAQAIKNLSPQQLAALMDAVFGVELASQLRGIGVSDPMMFVKAGAMPTDRAQLAKALNIPRGRLMALLMRAELLGIGPGRRGELAIRPEFIGPLRHIGVTMLATLAAMRGFSFEEIKALYTKFRHAAGGFKNTIQGKRVPVKRDLQHWIRSSSHRKSEILLADHEDYQGGLGQGEAHELVQAWYLENLLWEELDRAKRNTHRRLEERQRERQQHEKHQDDRQSSEQDRDEALWTEEQLTPDLEYDTTRSDRLMCFWIIDYDQNPQNPGQRRMYVCVDPENGALIPQYIEKDG